MNINLTVGDIVLFQPEKSNWSDWSTSDYSNDPENTYGVVLKAQRKNWVRVEWANGCRNVYKTKDDDLKKVGRLKKVKL